MKRLTVDKGLLRETEMVQKQIWALLRCDVGIRMASSFCVLWLICCQLVVDDVENEISLTAFRLLVLDLMTLYAVMNEGTINVLGTFNEREYTRRDSWTYPSIQNITSKCPDPIASVPWRYIRHSRRKRKRWLLTLVLQDDSKTRLDWKSRSSSTPPQT